MSTTKNWVVQPGGMTVREVNPFEQNYNGNIHTDWNEFEDNNPELHHTSKNPLKEGAVLQGEEIEQYYNFNKGIWFPKEDARPYYGANMGYHSRQAVQLVEEEKLSNEEINNRVNAAWSETSNPATTPPIADNTAADELEEYKIEKLANDAATAEYSILDERHETYYHAFISGYNTNKSAEKERESIQQHVEHVLSDDSLSDETVYVLTSLLYKIKAK